MSPSTSVTFLPLCLPKPKTGNPDLSFRINPAKSTNLNGLKRQQVILHHSPAPDSVPTVPKVPRRSPGIRYRTMRISKVFPTIKRISRAQGSLFHFVKNSLNIHGNRIFHIKIQFRPEKFFRQKGNIKTVGVKAGKITPLDSVGSPLSVA